MVLAFFPARCFLIHINDMAIHSIDHDIGFADSHFLGYERSNNILTVRLQAWNEKNLQFIFNDTIRVVDNDANEVVDVVWNDANTELLKQALHRLYGQLPTKHPFKHFQFLDLDYQSCLDVVARECSVETM